jgi:hypothetical protein
VRISSQKTQHRISVVGEALLDGEAPDRLALYLPDGTPVALDADPNKMKWRGAWVGDETYSTESVVTFEDTLWVALQDVLAGVVPGTDALMWEVMVGEVEPELPPGGADGNLLAKASTDDGDVAWINAASILPANELPPGGSTGYILAKASETDGDVYWIPAPSGGGGGGSGLPPGGTYAMLLAKASSVDGDAVWVMPPLELPAGGPSGYILRKASSADGHVAWVAPSVGVPNELPPTGATGDILAKGSDEAGDVIWIPPPSGGALPAGGTTSQVLAKNSSTDGDAGWVAPTPRDVPVGGSTGQVLTKNSSTDRDTGWTTPSSGGGGGSVDGIYLDEKFDSDTHLLYVEATTAASPTFVSGSAGQSYIYNPVSDGYFNRSDKAASIRNPMVLIETEWNGDSGHVIAIRLRRQSDRWIQIQVHPTNIHIYTTGPSSGADVLRTSTAVATLSAGRRAWIVAGVYHNQVFASFSEHHPFASSLTATRNSVVFDISTVADLGIEAQRIGRADQVRLAPGTTNQSLHRLFRHTIIDLDTFPVLP